MADKIIGFIILGVLFGATHYRNFYWRSRWYDITRGMR